MPFLLPNEQRQSTEVITLATNPDTFGSNLLELYTELSSQLATAAQSDAPELRSHHQSTHHNGNIPGA